MWTFTYLTFVLGELSVLSHIIKRTGVAGAVLLTAS